jgi:hypothetical protein
MRKMNPWEAFDEIRVSVCAGRSSAILEQIFADFKWRSAGTPDNGTGAPRGIGAAWPCCLCPTK